MFRDRNRRGRCVVINAAARKQTTLFDLCWVAVRESCDPYHSVRVFFQCEPHHKQKLVEVFSPRPDGQPVIDGDALICLVYAVLYRAGNNICDYIGQGLSRVHAAVMLGIIQQTDP